MKRKFILYFVSEINVTGEYVIKNKKNKGIVKEIDIKIKRKILFFIVSE
jgi:hypothetical protein